MPVSPALPSLAPEPFAAWERVRASVPGAIAAADLAVVESGVGAALGVPDAVRAVDADPACRVLVDQFVCDVASTSDAQRDAAFGVLGDRAFAFVQACYVTDMDTRMRAAWQQLLGVDAEHARGSEPGDLWADLEAFMRAVARLDALDAVTTEVVRLRGARAHNCRLCQSTRSVQAARAGADERLYDQIDAYDSDEESELSARQRVALRLVDAFLWQPLSYPADLAGDVSQVFTPVETVEIVLDVVRNAANKIAVLFAADAPHVTDGIEPFDVSPDGEVVYLPPETHDARS